MASSEGVLSADEKDRQKRLNISKPRGSPDTKISLKAFKSYVTRPSAQSTVFTMPYAIKEKKVQGERWKWPLETRTANCKKRMPKVKSHDAWLLTTKKAVRCWVHKRGSDQLQQMLASAIET